MSFNVLLLRKIAGGSAEQTGRRRKCISLTNDCNSSYRLALEALPVLMNEHIVILILVGDIYFITAVPLEATISSP
jgi:hypothetical protein